MDRGHSDALTLKQHQKELFFWVLTPDAGGSGGKGNSAMQIGTQGYVTSDLEERKGLSMVGIDAQLPPALYRICESRLYRANVQDSSSIEFSFQVTISLISAPRIHTMYLVFCNRDMQRLNLLVRISLSLPGTVLL
jgi:hypothetical protein